MVLSASRPDASLLEFLRYRARSASVARLTAQALLALALVLAAFGRFPFARSVIGSFGGTCFCYALWGLLDRGRAYSASRAWRSAERFLNVLCGLFACVGVLSALGLLFAIWFLALGSPWIL
jgi:hypothetical protein